MQDTTGRPAHIQRCTYQEIRHGRAWQCLEGDPHPSGVGHRFPIDSHFDRPLHEMHREKLAGLVRDHVALADSLQRRLNQLQAVAVDLAGCLAAGDQPTDPATSTWVRANHPTAARILGWAD